MSNKPQEKSLKDLKVELREKEEEKRKIKEKIRSKRTEGLKRLKRTEGLRRLGEPYIWTDGQFDPEEPFLIEEVGTPESSVDYVFYTKKDGNTKVASLTDKTNLEWNAFTKFLEEEIEPKQVHNHRFKIKHRIWEPARFERRLLIGLLNYDSLANGYLEDGWNGFKKALAKMDDEASYPLLTTMSTNWGVRNIANRVLTNPNELSEKLIWYSQRHELSIDEAITALSLEDQEFAKKRNQVKKIAEKVVESLKEALNHLLSGTASSESEDPAEEVRAG